MAIVALLIGGALYTLSAQIESHKWSQTKQNLEEASNLLLAYAVVHGRLPCPAVLSPSSNGAESIAVAAGTGTGGTCTAYYNGYLPAATIGYTPVDAGGFALDAWGNRIRYAVSQTSAPHFTSSASIVANWGSTQPADIDVCKQLGSTSATTCGSSANRVATSGTVVAVVWSQGKNYLSSGAASIDEGNNDDAFAAFVSRTPSDAASALGEFDDQLAWIPVGVLYGRLISAGRLP